MSATLRRLTLDAALSPADLLALEETLLLQLNEQPPTNTPFLFFFETTRPAVVMGTGQKVLEVVHRQAVDQDGVALLRRPSGGGCVMQMPGVVWFSLGVPFTWLPSGMAGGIRATFREVLQPVCEVLRARYGVFAELQGICDIAVPGESSAAAPTATAKAAADSLAVTSGSYASWRKIAGSAQCRKQRAVVVHGTLLMHADLRLLSRYLLQPEKQPEYRAGRSHDAFVANLTQENAAIQVPALCEAIAAAWLAVLGPQVAALPEGGGALELRAVELTAAERAAAAALADSKYRQDEWTLRL